MDLKKLTDQYKDELLDNVLPFWLEHSQDHEYGGYFTCLDRKGNVFDTDKVLDVAKDLQTVVFDAL